MRKITLDSIFEEYESFSHLPEADQALLKEAKEAANDAYAPYSHFHVGAAVELENGKIIRGSNQENAAYPSGLCAERVALFAAGAHFPGEQIRSIAITAHPEGPDNPSVPVSPCGDCRQVMSEFEQRYKHKIRLIMESGNGKYIVTPSVGQLLPFVFGADNMVKK